MMKLISSGRPSTAGSERVNAGIAIIAAATLLAATAIAAPQSAPSRPDVPTALVVYKSPQCGCCAKWAERMREAGFAVTLRHPADLDAVRQELGVPRSHGSCHTAMVGGYALAGHVPPADVQRLLKERPAARGLTVPGMPLGAPGMEGPNAAGFDVLLIHNDGTTSVFARHPSAQPTRP